MNLDNRATLQELAAITIDTAIKKMYFFHQNTNLIKPNQTKVLELIKATSETLQLVKNACLYIEPIKLSIIKNLVEDFLLLIDVDTDRTYFTVCNDAVMNNAIMQH